MEEEKLRKEMRKNKCCRREQKENTNSRGLRSSSLGSRSLLGTRRQASNSSEPAVDRLVVNSFTVDIDRHGAAAISVLVHGDGSE